MVEKEIDLTDLPVLDEEKVKEGAALLAEGHGWDKDRYHYDFVEGVLSVDTEPRTQGFGKPYQDSEKPNEDDSDDDIASEYDNMNVNGNLYGDAFLAIVVAEAEEKKAWVTPSEIEEIARKYDIADFSKDNSPSSHLWSLVQGGYVFRVRKNQGGSEFFYRANLKKVPELDNVSTDTKKGGFPWGPGTYFAAALEASDKIDGRVAGVQLVDDNPDHKSIGAVFAELCDKGFMEKGDPPESVPNAHVGYSLTKEGRRVAGNYRDYRMNHIRVHDLPQPNDSKVQDVLKGEGDDTSKGRT